ncbi:MAG: DUF3575 domain-containing protein [Spirochaetota bacterium]
MGLVYPLGDMGDAIDYAVSLPINAQYAVKPNISVELDGYYYIYTAEAAKGFDYSSYQFGLGGRYWLEKAFNGVYLGAGIARTNVETESEVTIPFVGTQKVKTDEDYTTLVLKAGYTMALDKIILDLGIRYDAIDMDEWANQPLTLYAMAVFPLSL